MSQRLLVSISYATAVAVALVCSASQTVQMQQPARLPASVVSERVVSPPLAQADVAARAPIRNVLTPVFVNTYRESGQRRVVLAVERSPVDESYDCHACRPLLSVLVFEQHGDAWQLIQRNHAVDAPGSFGQSKPLRLVKTGPDKHALALEATYTGQGVWEWLTLIGLSEERPAVILDQSLGESFDWDDDAIGNQSRWRSTAPDARGYYVLRQDRRGTRLSSRRPARAEATIYYAMTTVGFRAMRAGAVGRRPPIPGFASVRPRDESADVEPLPDFSMPSAMRQIYHRAPDQDGSVLLTEGDEVWKALSRDVGQYLQQSGNVWMEPWFVR